MSTSKQLFTTKILFNELNSRFHAGIDAIEQLRMQDFKENNDTTLINEIFTKHKIYPLEIFENEIQRSDPEEEIISNIKRVFLNLELPFIGDVFLWDCRPSRYMRTSCIGQVSQSPRDSNKGVLLIPIQLIYDDFIHGKGKQFIQENFSNIKEYLQFSEKDISTHNDKLLTKLKERIPVRRKELNDLFNAANDLGIPPKDDE